MFITLESNIMTILKKLFAQTTILFRNDYEILRCPDRIPKCYDMTEEEKRLAIMKLNRNIWNDHELTKQDNL